MNLESLYERKGVEHFDLPFELRRAYDGDFGLEETCVIANFVSSLDGVVALVGIKDSPSLISLRSEADRFMMGLLRASADAVLIGAGTMRDSPNHHWTAEFIAPEYKEQFGRLRKQIGMQSRPTLVVVSGSGNLPASHPAFSERTLAFAGTEGLGNLSSVSSQTEVLHIEQRISMNDVIEILNGRGLSRILVEAGPAVFGQLIEDDLVDELFLTLSPVIAGRGDGDRPGLVSGNEFLPDLLKRGTLLSAKRHDSHLFLRYHLRSAGN